jgi:hypothetical protein
MRRNTFTAYTLFFLLQFAFILTCIAQPLPNRYREEVFSTVNITNNIPFSTNIQTAEVTLEIAGNKIRTNESNLVTTTLRMDIYRPGNFVPAWGGGPDTLTKKPVIVLCFGGGFVTGSRTAWDMVALSNAFAKRGFVVGTIDYRLGMNIFDSDLATRAVYRGIQDGRSAVRYFKANAAALGIDTSHVYIAGYSAGAFIAYHNAFLDRESERPASTYSYTYSAIGCGFLGLFPCTAPNQGTLDGVGNNPGFYGKASLFMGFAGALGFLSNIEGPGDIPGVMSHSTDDSVVPYGYGQAFLTGLGFIGSIVGLVVDIPYTHGSGNVKNRMDIVGADGTLYTFTDRDHGPHKWDVNNNGDYDDDQTLYPESYINASEFAYQKKLKPKSTALTGNTNVCDGTVTETYSTNFTDFYYDWNISGGTFITPLATRQYSNTVTVQWAPGPGPRTLTVTPYSRQLARGQLLTLNALIPTSPDLAAIEITGATNGCGGLSATQSMTLKIKNVKCFNVAAGTSFNVTLTESTTGTSHTETITLPSAMNLNDEYTYTFLGTFNMSAAATYNFTGTVNITGDSNPANNSTTLTVVRTPIPAAPTVSNTAVCFGGTTPSFNATGSNITWYSDVALTTSVATGNAFTPSVSAVGTYTYYVTQTVSGCQSPAATVTLNINPLPTVALSAFAPVCVNAAAFALAGGTPAGGTYSGTGVSGGSFNPAVAGVGSHVITYSFTDVNGCTSTATQSITVQPLPTVSLTAFTPVCVNASAFTLTGGTPAGGTYSGTGVSGGSFNPAVAGVGSHVITYSFTDANGCTNSATQSITVNPLPTVTFTPTTPLCLDGASVTLSASPAGGVFSGTGVSGSEFNPAVAGAGTHAITYTYTDANGCTNSATQNITVHPLPAVNLVLPNLCTGGVTYNFTTGTPAGGTYTVDGVPATSFTPGTAPSTHTVVYTYTDANGCTNSVTRTLNVTNCATLSPPSAPAYLIVEAIDETSLRLRWNDAAGDEDGYEIYRSEDGANFTLFHTTGAYSSAEAVFINENLTPDKAYFYIVRTKRGSTRSGFTNSAYDYTYPLMPVLAYVTEACQGYTGTAAVSGTHQSGLFNWYLDGNLQRDSDGSIYGAAVFRVEKMFAPRTVLVASRGQKYESRQKLSINIGIKPLPVAFISSQNVKTCAESVMLEATAVAGAVYEWIINDRLYNVTTEPRVNATQNGVYRLRVQANGCANVANQFVEVQLNYKPEAVILQGVSTSFCQSGVLQAKVSAVSGTTYTWSKGGEIVGTGANLTVSKSGNYTLEINENGCINTANIVVAVTEFPESMNFATEGLLCEKSLLSVSANEVSGVSYEWFVNGRMLKAGRDGSIRFAARPGENRVELVLRNALNTECTKKYETEIFIEALPTANIERDGTTLKAMISGSYTGIEWYREGNRLPENDGKTSISPKEAGRYGYRITTSGGCEVSSGTIYFGITATENEEKKEKTFAIYPNPTSDWLYLRFAENTEANIYLYDASGRKVKEAFLSGSELKLDLSRFAAGMYTLEIRTEKGVMTEKIIKD